MRLFERLQYLAGLAYYINILAHHHFSQYILYGLIIILLVLGIWNEGLRLHQFPFLIGFIIQSIVFLINWSNLPLDIIGLILTCFSLTLLILYGEVDFNKIKMYGPYEVGYKEFKTKKYSNWVSVYYPIDKQHYKQMIKRHNVKWLRNGDKTLLGIAKATAEYGTDKHLSVHIFRHLRQVMMDTVMNGEIHSDFYNKPIIPIIYLHGMCSNRTMHSVTCRDLASNGYMVFVMDHHDGSSSFIMNEEGEEKYFDPTIYHYNLQPRKAQTILREREVIAFIDEIEQQDEFLHNKLKMNPKITLDFEKLIISGHSFGGNTAISLAVQDPRIKLLFTLDPWLFVYQNEIMENEFKLNIPFFSVSTQHFHQYCKNENRKALANLFEQSTSPIQENLFYLNCCHFHQCDVIALVPLEFHLLAKFLPRLNYCDIYQGQQKVVLNFLAKTGFTNKTFDEQKIAKDVQEMKERWLRYEIEYQNIEIDNTLGDTLYEPPEIEIAKNK